LHFPFQGIFDGTLAVDVTNGTVSSVNVTFPGLTAFADILASSPFSGEWVVSVGVSTLHVILKFTTTMPDSLVGFSGGNITGGDVVDSTGHTSFSTFSGTITPAIATVPDQGSSLTLPVAGASGLLALRFTRYFSDHPNGQRKALSGRASLSWQTSLAFAAT
jgi:hypothetical protein